MTGNAETEENEDVRQALNAALAIIDAYGEAEGYWPHGTADDVAKLEKILAKRPYLHSAHAGCTLHS